MQRSINDILLQDEKHALSEMIYTSLSIETLVSAFLSIEKIQFACNSCALLEVENAEIGFLEKAMSIISKRFQEKLTIPDIAREVGTNQCYLKKKFKLHYGDTIFGTITGIRMNKAHEMIKSDSNRKLSEIAESVGYSSLSSFSTAFKQYFGFTPQELRK
jgi:AraC-like DNA-binding protein